MNLSHTISTVRLLDLAECSVCLDTVSNPRCLPCLHTFCLDCLKKHGKDRQAGDQMDCPLCRKPFSIPMKGFEDLPVNFLVEKLKDEINEATQRTYEPASAAAEQQPRYCDAHKEEQLRLFCYDCEMVICEECSITKHKTHFREAIEEHSRKLNEELKTCKSTLSNRTEDSEFELELLQAYEADLLKQISAKKQAIDEHCKEFKRLVDAQGNELNTQLDAFKNKTLKTTQKSKDEIVEQIKAMTSSNKKIKELTENGVLWDILSRSKDLISKTEDLMKSSDAINKRRSRPVDVNFSAALIPEHSSDRTGFVGRLNFGERAPESQFMAVGLYDGTQMSQRVSRVSLSRPHSVVTDDVTPTWIDVEAAACVLRNSLYVVGAGHSYNELWRWNAASDWKRLSDMETGRRMHCAVAACSRLYALGGGIYCGGETTLSSIVSYDTDGEKWSVCGNLNVAVCSATCVGYKNSLYVFGGLDKNGRPTDVVQRFNIDRGSCTQLVPGMPRAYGALRAVVWNTYAIVLGGHACFVYDFNTQTWLPPRNDFRTDVHHFGLTVENDTLYIAGGGRSQRDKDKKNVWACKDEVRCVAVSDVIEGKPAAWSLHANLPQPALIHAFGPKPLLLPACLLHMVCG